MNITVVLPYHAGDYQLAKQLLEWIKELSGWSRQKSILLVGDSSVATEDRLALKAFASEIFSHVESLPTMAPKGWPDGANQMWITAAKYIEGNYKNPWLWLEPDAVPLNPFWLDILAVEYANQPKQFMGHIEESTDPALPKRHLAGVAVYPVNAYSIMASSIKAGIAFDISGAPAVIQKTSHTPHIQHFWGQFDLPPTFVKERTAESPKNAFTLQHLKSDAVIFHRCKDGTLIPLLREKRNAEKPQKYVFASAEPGFPSLAETHQQLEGFSAMTNDEFSAKLEAIAAKTKIHTGPIESEPSTVECVNAKFTGKELDFKTGEVRDAAPPSMIQPSPLPQQQTSDTPVKRKPGRPKKVTASQ